MPSPHPPPYTPHPSSSSSPSRTHEPLTHLDSSSTLAVPIPTFPSPPSPPSPSRSPPRAPLIPSLPLLSLASLTLGILCLVALVIILHHYDGGPVPAFGADFDTRLGLSTVVSIVTTAAKAFLSVPLREAVAAQKWVYFARRPRRLSRFATFDAAAKGVVGAGKNLAGASPFVLMLGFTLEPFSQQLLAERVALVPVQGERGAVGRARSWSDGLSGRNGTGVNIIGNGASSSQSGFLSAGMSGAIWNGMSAAGLSLDSSCPGGNCAFESYQTCAVCARLADVSNKLSPRTVFDADGGYNTTSWCLSDGACFGEQSWSCDNNTGKCNSTSQTGNSLGPSIIQVSPAVSRQDASPLAANASIPHILQFNESLAFTNISSPIADAFVLIQNDVSRSTACDLAWGPWCFGPYWGYSAWELALQWCVQNYPVSVEDGQVALQSSGSSGNFSISEPGGNLTSSQPEVDGELYSVSYESHSDLQNYFADLFNGSAGKTDFPDWSSNWWATSTSMQTFISPWNLTWSDEWPDPAAFSLFLDNIAASMTVYIQNQALSQSRLINGTASHSIPIVSIRWRWISGLSIFTALITVLLLATIVEQSVIRLQGAGNSWKSSLATTHALDPALQAGLSGITDDKRLAEQDAGTRVRLEFVEGEGWRLREGGVKGGIV